jgi:exodeoxyribonuclease V
MMVVKNNYFWMSENEVTDFIANGDIIRNCTHHKYEEMYGFRFADAWSGLSTTNLEIEVKLLLDTIYSETAVTQQTQNKNLFYSVMEDYAEITNKAQKIRKGQDKPVVQCPAGKVCLCRYLSQGTGRTMEECLY